MTYYWRVSCEWCGWGHDFADDESTHYDGKRTAFIWGSYHAHQPVKIQKIKEKEAQSIWKIISTSLKSVFR